MTGRIELVTDRRRVVLGGGLVLAFGFAAVKAHAASTERRVNNAGPQPVSNQEVADVAGEGFVGFAPDAFIRIAHDNAVSLIIPNVEMGQGIYTGECMLIAEELEVGLDQVRVVPAPPNEALYKQPLLQFQGTGGSTSIRGSWEPLRKAGAAARTLLIQAAAQGWGVDPLTCGAVRGTVVHAASGRSVTFGQVVEAASRLPKPEQVALKDPSQFKLIGKPLQRIDTPSKANGSAIFGIDVMVAGMKFAAVTNCPVLGGQVAGIDDTAALTVPGVVQVVRLPSAVAVVGDHFWAAKRGLDALKITWSPGANANLSSAWLWQDMARAAEGGAAAVALKSGDFVRAYNDAHHQVSVEYRQPFLCHAPMEPQAAVVHVRGGEVEIWCGTQVPSRAQGDVAKALGVAPEKVIIHNHVIGGGFGRKLETDYVLQAVAIARACAFPVKMIWSREEDMQHDNYRPMYIDRIAAGLDTDGRPTAWRHRVTAASVTARFAPAGMRPNGVDPDAVEEAEDPVYGAFPNMTVDYVQWRPPPGVVVSWWRGVGPTHNVFVVESFIDELAHTASKDPVEYRRMLLAKSPRARAVLDQAAHDAGWSSALPRGVGRGVVVQKSFGSYLAVVVEAAVSDDGDVALRRITAAIDCGLTINPNTVKQQIEGGLIFGLTAALHQEITLAGGRVQQSNFNDYRMLRINETPPMMVRHMLTPNPPGGIGETGTTAAAPALCNAIFAATGARLRELPIRRELLRSNARRLAKGPGGRLPVGLAIIGAAIEGAVRPSIEEER